MVKKSLILFPTLVLSLILGVAWKTGAQANIQPHERNQLEAITPQPLVQEMIDQVSQERLLADLRRFTGVDQMCTTHGCTTLNGRFTESQNLQWTKDYVYESLVDLNYHVEVLNWERNGYSEQNILAHKRGIRYPDDEIYFIAHLDGYPENGPAADDNGTGAVALLELARILAHRGLSYSVTIFFSTGEEQGAQGAHQFVVDYPDRVDQIKYLVNVEMLGYDSNNDQKMEFFNGSQPPDFVQALIEIIHTYPLNLDPHIYSDCG